MFHTVNVHGKKDVLYSSGLAVLIKFAKVIQPCAYIIIYIYTYVYKEYIQ